MTVIRQDTTTHHLRTSVMAAAAAVALSVSAVIGFDIADSDSSPAVTGSPAAQTQELPTRFGEGHQGSPDALERRAATDDLRYGSPDAAEEHNR